MNKWKVDCKYNNGYIDVFGIYSEADPMGSNNNAKFLAI